MTAATDPIIGTFDVPWLAINWSGTQDPTEIHKLHQPVVGTFVSTDTYLSNEFKEWLTEHRAAGLSTKYVRFEVSDNSVSGSGYSAKNIGLVFEIDNRAAAAEFALRWT